MPSAPPIEVRIHGRGSQGTVVAAYLLAASAVRAGFSSQAFPTLGPNDAVRLRRLSLAFGRQRSCVVAR